MMRELVGPSHNLCWLHLYEKKKGVYRTIAMFTSIWRLLMAATSQDFRKWDLEEADCFDTAKAVGKATLSLMRESHS